MDPDVVEDDDRGLGRLLQDVRHANDVPRRVEVLGLLFLQTTWRRVELKKATDTKVLRMVSTMLETILPSPLWFRVCFPLLLFKSCWISVKFKEK